MTPSEWAAKTANDMEVCQTPEEAEAVLHVSFAEAIAAERERCARVCQTWKIPANHWLDRPLTDAEVTLIGTLREEFARVIRGAV